MTALSDPEDGLPLAPPITLPDASPEAFPLPLDLDDIRTPLPSPHDHPPPQDLIVLIGELATQVQTWRTVASDQRVPEDVRNIYHRCADTIARILRERAPTDVSELAPESR